MIQRDFRVLHVPFLLLTFFIALGSASLMFVVVVVVVVISLFSLFPSFLSLPVESAVVAVAVDILVSVLGFTE